MTLRNLTPTDKAVRLLSTVHSTTGVTVTYEHRTTGRRAWMDRAKDGEQGQWSVYDAQGEHASGLKKAAAVRATCELCLRQP